MAKMEVVEKPTATIQLTRGYKTTVDSTDYPALSRYKWFAKFSFTGAKPYAARNSKVGENGNGEKRRTIRMHTQLMDPATGMEVDHKDNDTLNNRRCNLEVVTKQENLQNRSYK